MNMSSISRRTGVFSQVFFGSEPGWRAARTRMDDVVSFDALMCQRGLKVSGRSELAACY